MWITVILFMCSIEMLSSLNFIELPVVVETADIETVKTQHEDKYKGNNYEYQAKSKEDSSQELTEKSYRRKNEKSVLRQRESGGELKDKISTLVEQTLYDTAKKLKSIQSLKDKHREQAPYRVGFILNMVKKSRDILNELFNVAVKHRDDWKILEQMKLFELIVHTNVDTTNLVRQLVETHIQFMNSSSGLSEGQSLGMLRKRVVLL